MCAAPLKHTGPKNRCWSDDDVREIVVYLRSMNIHLKEMVVYLAMMIIE